MSRRQAWRTWAAIVATTMATVGVVLGQRPDGNPDAPANTKAKSAPRKTRKGGLLIRGGTAPKAAKAAVDPLAKVQAKDQANLKAPPRWPFHYKFKLQSEDGTALSARYYPAKAGALAPVLLLVHQSGTGHSGQDFEQPVESLKGQTLAEHYQQLEYAVMIIDRRGYGSAEARQQVVSRDPTVLASDLQTAYSFLIGRHNLRELNLAKLGVVAVGDGANLAALWAASPEGAVSSPGRISDLGGMVLVSSSNEAFGSRLVTPIASIAPRFPLFLASGSKDSEAFNNARPLVERNRASKGVLFDSRLQGDRLLLFEPKAIPMVDKFLDEPVKFRPNTEWEPRYLLNPIEYADVEVIQSKALPEDADKKKAEPEKKKAEPTKKALPADKKDADKDKAEAEAK